MENKNSAYVPSHIWHIAGELPGPNVVVLGGTHGDEMVGVEVVKKLLTHFKLSDTAYGVSYPNEKISGNLFIGFGNPKAIERGTRSAGNGPDLNRSFQMSELQANPSDDDRYDLERARELFPLLEQTDFLFDLHSTHAQSVPFVCMGNTSREHEALYSIVPADYVLIDPDSVLSKDFGKEELGTTDYAVNVFGGSEWSKKKYGKKRGIAFAYESGSKKEIHKVEEVYDTVCRLLEKVGILKNDLPQAEIKYHAQKRYKLAGIIKAQEEGGFVFAEGMKEGWVEVQKGDVIGSYIKSGKKEQIPFNGVLIFQKETSNVAKGESLCYAGILITDI